MAQLLVQRKQAGCVFADKLELLQYLSGRGFFLNLFGNKPLQKDIGGMVPLIKRQIDQIVDQAGDLLLVIIHFQRQPGSISIPPGAPQWP